MSAPSSTKKSAKTPSQPPSPAPSTDAASDSDNDEYPSTRIGSYLSWQYDWAVESKKVPGFTCGSCHATNQLRARESLRCRECGYRILYKERLRRPMIYSAQ